MSALFRGMLNNRMVGNAVLYTLGSVVQRGALLLVLPLYTFYLPPSEFGVWSLLVTLIVLIVSIADLGGRNATVRLFYEYRDDPQQSRSFLFSAFLAKVATGVLVFALVLVAGRPLWEMIFAGTAPFLPFAPLLATAVAAELIVSHTQSVLRVQERAGRYVLLVLVQTSLQIAGSLFFIIVLGQGALGPLNGLLLASGTTALIASLLFLFDHGSPPLRFRTAHVREALAFGLPLVPHHVGTWLRNSADRFVLVQFVPLATVGVYHLGYSAGLAIMLLAKGMNMAYEPYYYRLKKTHPSPGVIIRSVAGIMGAGLGAVCLLGLLFVEEVVVLLLAPAYHGAAVVAPLILASYLLHGFNTQLKKPLLYYRKTWLIARLTLIPGLLSFGLCFVFIPMWGVMAAVWLTFANHLAVTLLIGAANRWLSPGQYPLGRLALCYSIVVVGAVWVTYQGSAWIPAAVPLAKAAFLATYAAIAWLLLVRGPLMMMHRWSPRPAAGSLAQAGPPP